jgi:NADPH-dependent glutamate synthase beta subunit-like oxidoreductase
VLKLSSNVSDAFPKVLKLSSEVSECKPLPAGAVVAMATPASGSNIVVFGGTGGTGSECVVQALAAGAKVTAGRFQGYRPPECRMHSQHSLILTQPRPLRLSSYRPVSHREEWGVADCLLMAYRCTRGCGEGLLTICS